MSNFDAIIKLLEKSGNYYIICIDMAGSYTYINSNYAEKFRHIDSNFVGKPFHITMHPDDVAACAAAGAQSLKDKNALVPATIRKHNGSGGYIITRWEFKGMFDDEGKPAGVFCLGYDITGFIEELEKKDNLLNDIAHSQSHVVRKPLANILGVLLLLQHAVIPPETAELLDILYKNALELDEVIKEIADEIYP